MVRLTMNKRFLRQLRDRPSAGRSADRNHPAGTEMPASSSAPLTERRPSMGSFPADSALARNSATADRLAADGLFMGSAGGYPDRPAGKGAAGEHLSSRYLLLLQLSGQQQAGAAWSGKGSTGQPHIRMPVRLARHVLSGRLHPGDRHHLQARAHALHHRCCVEERDLGEGEQGVNRYRCPVFKHDAENQDRRAEGCVQRTAWGELLELDEELLPSSWSWRRVSMATRPWANKWLSGAVLSAFFAHTN